MSTLGEVAPFQARRTVFIPPTLFCSALSWSDPGVAVAVGVGVAVAVGVGDGDPQGPARRLLSTTFVSPLSLDPPTTNKRFPIAVPPVKECGTLVFGPLLQLFLVVS